MMATDAAVLLGVKPAYVRRLCEQQQLRATKCGRAGGPTWWEIEPQAVEEFQRARRPRGRPRKPRT